MSPANYSSLFVILSLLFSSSVDAWTTTSPFFKIFDSNIKNEATALAVGLTFAAVLPDSPPNIAAGSKVFESTCSSCHPNGQNKIAKERTLEKESLEKYVGLDPSDIQQYMRADFLHRGANLFGGELSDEDMKNVVGYVLDQAVENKW